MSERFGRKLRALAAVGLVATSAAEARKIDLEKFPKNGSPVMIAELLREKAQSQGHMTEAVAVSVRNGNAYVSAAADPGFGIVQSTEYLHIFDRLQKEYKITLDGKEVWLAHNHAADHITAYAVSGGLSEDVITRPQALLNGPSLYDCRVSFSDRNLFKGYVKTSVINLIVEPGGNWVCSGEYPNKGFSDDVAAEYDLVRQQLLIVTQSTKKDVRAAISKFEKEVFRLTGVKVKFVPHGAPAVDLERAKEEVCR
ncbi:MAG: hypothetical protein WAZ27_03040 [Minisyncoccia bacterium]